MINNRKKPAKTIIIYNIRYNNPHLNMSVVLEDILEQARQDPELQITPEYLQNWMEENDIEDHCHYLVDKTTNDVQQENDTIVKSLECINFETKKQYIDRLKGWRFVEDLRDFQRGKHVRFIHKKKGKMTNPMIGLDLKFNKNGTTVMARYMNGGPIAIQHNFDDHFVFQKITAEEYMVLLANQYTQTTKNSV